MVGEDPRDKGGALVRGAGTLDQALPRWNVAARGKLVKVTCPWSKARNSQTAQNIRRFRAQVSFLVPETLGQCP